MALLFGLSETLIGSLDAPDITNWHSVTARFAGYAIGSDSADDHSPSEQSTCSEAVDPPAAIHLWYF
jgi:hypothetical protein